MPMMLGVFVVVPGDAMVGREVCRLGTRGEGNSHAPACP